MRRRAWPVRVLMLTSLTMWPAAATAQQMGSVHVAMRIADPVTNVRQAVPFPRLALSFEKVGEVAEPVRTTTSDLGTADLMLGPGTYVVKSLRQWPFEGKYYQWTRTIEVRDGEATNLELTADNAVVQAIPPAAPRPPAPATPPAPARVSTFLAVDGGYHAALGWGGAATLMVPIGAVSHEDGLTGLAGVLASGRAGPGGWQISGGRFMAGAPFWSDIQGTVLRTSAAPLKGTGHSTYVGGEVGIAPFPVGLLHGHFLMARPTLGVLRRVSGPAGPGATMFTWSVNINTWFGFRER